MTLAFDAMIFEGLLQLGRLGVLRRFLAGLHGLFLGVVNVLSVS